MPSQSTSTDYQASCQASCRPSGTDQRLAELPVPAISQVELGPRIYSKLAGKQRTAPASRGYLDSSDVVFLGVVALVSSRKVQRRQKGAFQFFGESHAHLSSGVHQQNWKKMHLERLGNNLGSLL